jgi:hypothetical protein
MRAAGLFKGPVAFFVLAMTGTTVMRMKLRLYGIWMLALLMSTTVTARDAAEDAMCREGGFGDDAVVFSLARVAAGDKLHFLDDLHGCPEQGDVACRRKAYVLPGDVLLIGKRRGAYACAFYPGASGGSAGWVSVARLAPIEVEPAPALERWSGTWSEGDNRIVITAKGHGLHAQGEAWWPMRDPPEDSFPNGPNSGAFAADATPQRQAVIFHDQDCEVHASLVNDWLVVGDNRTCGGLNVTFSGVYRRVSGR